MATSYIDVINRFKTYIQEGGKFSDVARDADKYIEYGLKNEKRHPYHEQPYKAYRLLNLTQERLEPGGEIDANPTTKRRYNKLNGHLEGRFESIRNGKKRLKFGKLVGGVILLVASASWLYNKLCGGASLSSELKNPENGR